MGTEKDKKFNSSSSYYGKVYYVSNSKNNTFHDDVNCWSMPTSIKFRKCSFIFSKTTINIIINKGIFTNA